MIKTTSEETSKGTDKANVAVPCGNSSGHSNHILFSNEALNIAIIKLLLIGQRVSGILCVSIKGIYTFIVCSNFDKSFTI